ncbi:VWA domain-containing protein [bacterium SCSIO 12696]|nr:VWA domain-containing protein [bacterium SCSIO 12696]
MARKKRGFSPFSLSFLDIMACGFGAVTLLFLILKHDPTTITTADPNIAAEVKLLQEDIRQGKEDLVILRNSLADVEDNTDDAQGLSERIVERIKQLQRELSAQKDPEQEVATLRKQVEELEEEISTLEEQSRDSDTRQFVGQGDRQYLTGLKLGGRNVLILLDASASMLAEDIVNTVIRRNQSDEVKKRADKWQRAVKTVEWLVSQMPPSTQVQVVTFNTTTNTMVELENSDYASVADAEELDQLFTNLGDVVPGDGTSLVNAFQSINQLEPRPDNLFLITDGLPTQGDSAPRRATITGRDRERLFSRALEALPNNLPVNVVLFPFEGDPTAAAAFWRLALATQGSFMSPSKDWP